MFWKKSGRGPTEQGSEEVVGNGPGDGPGNGPGNSPGAIYIERDAERPETILKVAGELERRGAEVVELFKNIDTPRGRAVLPIHLIWKKQDFFVEIETRAWKSTSVEKALDTAAALRSSDYEEAGLGLLSAYPVPDEVDYFFGRSPVALMQLDLYAGRREAAEDRAALFVESVRRRLDTELDYELKSLPSVEELLTDSLQGDEAPEQGHGRSTPILSSLAECLGCYVGEVIRRNTDSLGEWVEPEDGRGETLLEIDDFDLDPIGNAQAFLKNGPEDSVAYYARYVLRQIREESGPK